MKLKAVLGKAYAALVVRQMQWWKRDGVKSQENVFHSLIKSGQFTQFGKEHYFDKITSYQDFKRLVPIRDYEDFKPYIDEILEGKDDILWPGKPLYFAKTSGTTSGVKYIPISKDSMPQHVKAARNALLCYINETGNTDFIDGKMIFLQGSPVLEKKHGISIGRLSGIVAHHVPAYLQNNRMPSYEVNCIEDWENKVDAIVEETIHENMTLISGIPPWCQMYFDKLSAKANKKVKDIFPNFKLFVHGGVNYEPYRAKMEDTIGASVDSIETYPASEGFIAFQDSQKDSSLLLLVDGGIFYEFVAADEFYVKNPKRISLKDVELEKNYALILSTNAGLWAYAIGDTIKFVSKNPYKIKVTGRVKHFISAFGEHVIAEEVEYALLTAAKEFDADITEFTVAPKINPEEGGLPYHEWWIEFSKKPVDITLFAKKVDELLQQKNIYYKDLITGNILKTLMIRNLKKNAFIDFMREEGKLGGQNKVPRLSNDRKIADRLKKFVV